MKRLLLAAALAAAMIGTAATGFAQQQPAPGDGAQLATCSQMAAFCNSGCESAGGAQHRMCQSTCQTHRAECMATGLWKNVSTGRLIPKRKE